MDQNAASTPRGGPLPKKTNYGRAFLNDSNIEPTLMDTTNFTRQFNATASKNTSEKPVSNNYEGDSLDELTFMEQIKLTKNSFDASNLNKHEMSLLGVEAKNLSNASILSPGQQHSNMHPNTPCEADSIVMEQTLEPEAVKSALEMVPENVQNVSASFVFSRKQQSFKETPEKQVEPIDEPQFFEDTKNMSASFAFTPQKHPATPRVDFEVQDPEFTQQTPRLDSSVANQSVHSNLKRSFQHPSTPHSFTKEHSTQKVEYPEDINNSTKFASFVLSPQQSFSDYPRIAQYDEHVPEPNVSVRRNSTLSTIQEDSEQLRTPFGGSQKIPFDPSEKNSSIQQSFVFSPRQHSMNKTNTPREASFMSEKSTLSPKINKSALEMASEDAGHPLYKNSFIVSPLQQQLSQIKVQEPEAANASIQSTKMEVQEPINETPVRNTSIDFTVNENAHNSTVQSTKITVDQKSGQKDSFMMSPALDNLKHSITIFESNMITENTVYEQVNAGNGMERTAVDLNATLSEIVEISSLIRDVVEAEVPVESEQMDNFSDKLSNLDFMLAEYAVAVLNRQIPKVRMPEITDNLSDCVRTLINLVNGSNKTKFEAINQKDRDDFEYTLNVERQKNKNGKQEREMLCTRINELEQSEKEAQLKNLELEQELERCMQSLDEADSLEAQLLQYKTKYNELLNKFNAKK